jgi:hypothetical protein
VPTDGACDSDCKDRIKLSLKLAEVRCVNEAVQVLASAGYEYTAHLMEQSEEFAAATDSASTETFLELFGYFNDLVTDIEARFARKIEYAFDEVNWAIRDEDTLDDGTLEGIVEDDLEFRWSLNQAEIIEYLMLVQMDWADEVMSLYEDGLGEDVSEASEYMEVISQQHDAAWEAKRAIEKQWTG